MAQKFWTTVSRVVDGRYVHASPDQPALVSFPDDLKIPKEDRTLTPYEKTKPEPPEAQPLKAHFAKIDRGPSRLDPRNARPSDVDPAQK